MNHLLNPDRETIIIGGFGSDAVCVDRAAANLSSVLPKQVFGITSREARKHLSHLAEYADGRNIIPYSGSATIAAHIARRPDVTPASINFVSPPDRISRYGAVHGFVKAALARSNAAQNSEEGAVAQTGRFIREIASHPDNYYRLIHESRRFEQLAAAVSLKSLGIERVNLIIPRDDEMFSSYGISLDSDSDSEGVRYVVIDGGHTRFSNDASGVFLEAQSAPYAVITEQTLSRDLPERIQQAPTVSSALGASVGALRAKVVRSRLAFSD